MKSHYRLDQLPSRKASVVEALMLASVITWATRSSLIEKVDMEAVWSR